MSLNKKRMVREIGRRTRLSNRDVERVIETLMDVWTEELASEGRIELQNFFVLEGQAIDRARIEVASIDEVISQPVSFGVKLRVSKVLRIRLSSLNRMKSGTSSQ